MKTWMNKFTYCRECGRVPGHYGKALGSYCPDCGNIPALRSHGLAYEDSDGMPEWLDGSLPLSELDLCLVQYGCGADARFFVRSSRLPVQFWAGQTSAGGLSGLYGWSSCKQALAAMARNEWRVPTGLFGEYVPYSSPHQRMPSCPDARKQLEPMRVSEEALARGPGEAEGCVVCGHACTT